MLFYLAILLFVLIMGCLESRGSKIPYSKEIVFMVLWIAAGTSFNFSIDNQSYRDMYDDPSNAGNLFLEPVWIWIADMLRSLHLASRAWFMLTSLAITALFMRGIDKLSINYWVSIILYVACNFYFESLNGIRQYVAMAIVFSATSLLLQKQIYKYMIAVIVAAQFHSSAYFMIPMVFVTRIKFPDWILLIGLVITFVFGSHLMDWILSSVLGALDLSNYSTYVDNAQIEQANSGLLKVFLNMLAILILLVAGRVRRISPQSYLYINMVLIGVMIYNIFLTFQAGMRLYWYLFVFIVILVPVIMEAFTPKSRLVVFGTVLGIFILFSVKMYSYRDMNYSFDLNLLDNDKYISY